MSCTKNGNQRGYCPKRKEVKAMARDGTGRGGARVGAGRKKKALTDRINDGGTAMVLDLPEPSEMSEEEMPPGRDHLAFFILFLYLVLAVVAGRILF